MKKILVPTDFSKPSIIAAGVAVDIAQKYGADVIFLNVVEEATGGSFNVEGEVSKGNMEDRLRLTLTTEYRILNTEFG